MRTILFAIVLLGAGFHTAWAVDLRILIPLYSYPEWYTPSSYLWNDVALAGQRVPITAILNPDDGPGTGFPNSDYQVGMSNLWAGGVTMVGYVFTSYGARNPNLVKADIAAYGSNSMMRGIFLDEAASGTNQLAYYQDLYAFIHARTNLATVILNPGTTIAGEYLSSPAADIAVIFENDTGWPSYVADAYVRSYSPHRFSALFYDVPTLETMQTNVDLAVQRNVGWVYATDDAGANPWDRLPVYWTQLVDYVHSYRQLASTGIQASSGSLHLAFQTISNRPFAIEYTATPLASAWSNLTASSISTQDWVMATDPLSSYSQRFYRLHLFP
ncbi:MAG: spherulation-specific family 4 protein [Lentisphaerota bacterium]